MTDHYVTPDGAYAGGFGDGAEPEDLSLINIGDRPPEYADQVWLFSKTGDPLWSESPSAARNREVAWQSSEMGIISNQLLALEEEAEDALPGDRKAWLAYRTKVRLWHESPDFPEQEKRPVRPS